MRLFSLNHFRDGGDLKTKALHQAQHLGSSARRPAPRPGRSRTIWWIIAAGVALIAVIAIGTAVLVSGFRDRARAETKHELDNTAYIIAEHCEGTFQSVELVQKNMIEQMQSLGVASSDDLERLMSGPDAQLILKDVVSGLPQLDALSLVSPSGKLINSSRALPTPGTIETEREYFKALTSDKSLMLFLSEPERSRRTGAWTTYLVRRLLGPNGEFIGMIVGVMELRHFEQFFGSISTGKEVAIALFRSDGTLLARDPHVEPTIGRASLETPLFQDTWTAADEADRLASLQALTHYPVVVSVSTTASAALAKWLPEAETIVGAVALAALSIGIYVLLIVRKMGQGIRLSRQRLRAQKLQLDTALNNMSQGLLMCDSEERVVLCNRRYMEIYGVPEEMVARRCSRSELIAHHYATGVLVGDPAHHLARTAGDVAQRRPYTRTLETSDGRTIFVINRWIEDGMWVSTHEDITERRGVEAQLRQAQKMEAVGNLTGGVAHDFNNLLTVIIGNLDLLQEDIAGSRAAEQKVETILQAAERGAELTRLMLAFSRRQPLQSKPVDVNELIRNTTRLLGRTLGEEISIKLKASRDVRPALVDESQLETALLNIAINARDAMPDGGTLTITTANAELDADYTALHPGVTAGPYVRIEIADTGTGMPADVVERIFEPFFTTKTVGKGTGLGLSMVYGFMKQSGGHIMVYSEVGHGTAFKLFLPLARQAEAQAQSPPLAPDLPARHGRNAVILAVDDNPDVRATVVVQLQDLGYQVREADSAHSALAILNGSERVDLLFTDVVMPGGLNGKELATKARTKRPELKVLFTSGFPGTSTGPGTNIDEGDVLLSKPYRKHDLAKAVEEVLTARS
ncbi:MAG TPA: PAS-domain containing protein [Xanthobacteraceae bacterium]